MRASLFTIALCVTLLGAGAAANPAAAAACDGLAGFRVELLQVGKEWVDATTRVGVDYTADPATFDSADWAAFAELAREKQDNLEQIPAPGWLDEWLTVQADAAGMQATAGDAAAQGGVVAVQQFSDEFAALFDRDEVTTSAAIERCPAFAATNAQWDKLNQDFQTGAATPAPNGSPASQAPQAGTQWFGGLKIVQN
jgi:hypothetical protein